MPATLPHQPADTPKQADQPLRIGNVNVDPPVLQALWRDTQITPFGKLLESLVAGLLATEMIAAQCHLARNEPK